MGALCSEFTQSASPEFKPIVEKIDKIMRESEPDLSSAIKWSQLTYAKDGDFHHWICAIKITRKFVSLSFHFGGLLDDPEKIFIAGASKFMRKIEYRRTDEVDPKTISGFIHQALDKLEYFKTNWREIQAEG